MSSKVDTLIFQGWNSFFQKLAAQTCQRGREASVSLQLSHN